MDEQGWPDGDEWWIDQGSADGGEWWMMPLDADAVADSVAGVADEAEQDMAGGIPPGNPAPPPAATTAHLEAQLPATAVELDARLTPGTMRRKRLYVSRHVCAPWAGPVLRTFFGMIHQVPTIAALIRLRRLFDFTGPVTYHERRKLELLAAPFEAHQDEISRLLENPWVKWTVVSTLQFYIRRPGDKDDAKIHGNYFLEPRGLA
jgi:hypothetical protein